MKVSGKHLPSYLIYLLPVILLVVHLPFLTADPDYFLSHSRDAHTDEGLNTSQVRNFVNGYGISAWECDNLVKNPLFNVMVAGPFYVLGTKMWVGRIAVLAFVLGIFTWLLSRKKFRGVMAVFGLTGLLQFHVFAYSHHSMAEMAAASCQLVTVMFLWNHLMHRKKSDLIISLIFSCFAWYFKIQFAYFILFIPPVLVIDFLVAWWRAKSFPKIIFYRGLLSAGILLTGLGLYYAGWYLQVKGAFDYILGNQTSGRFFNATSWRTVLDENFSIMYSLPQVNYFFQAFLLALILGIILFIRSRNNSLRTLFLLGFWWVMMELHKFAMIHVPSRYLVSTYVSAGFLLAVISWMAVEVYRTYSPRSIIRYVSLMIIVTSLYSVYHHTLQLTESYRRRTFVIHEINQFMKQKGADGKTVLGPWAPSLTWGTTARAIPVWKDYLNDKNIMETFHPAGIFAEPGEDDSNQAFASDGVDLSAAPETYTREVGKWTVSLYWYGD